MGAGVDEGARLRTGGGRLADEAGSIVQPTVFDQGDPTMRLAREQIFGPVLSRATG